jgi:hypothetical protein
MVNTNDGKGQTFDYGLRQPSSVKSLFARAIVICLAIMGLLALGAGFWKISASGSIKISKYELIYGSAPGRNEAEGSEPGLFLAIASEVPGGSLGTRLAYRWYCAGFQLLQFEDLGRTSWRDGLYSELTIPYWCGAIPVSLAAILLCRLWIARRSGLNAIGKDSLNRV